jgi:hypothetical protein
MAARNIPPGARWPNLEIAAGVERAYARPSIAGRAQSRSAALRAVAIGAVAVGALAFGAMAIGRLSIRKARIRSLEVDDLTVRNLNIVEDIRPDSKSQA